MAAWMLVQSIMMKLQRLCLAACGGYNCSTPVCRACVAVQPSPRAAMVVAPSRQNLVVAVLAFGMGMVFHELFGITALGGTAVQPCSGSLTASGSSSPGGRPTNVTAFSPSPSRSSHGDGGVVVHREDGSQLASDASHPGTQPVTQSSPSQAAVSGGGTAAGSGAASSGANTSTTASSTGMPGVSKGSATGSAATEGMGRGRGMQVAAVVQGLGDAWYGYGNRSKCDPLPPLPPTIPCDGFEVVQQPSQ